MDDPFPDPLPKFGPVTADELNAAVGFPGLPYAEKVLSEFQIARKDSPESLCNKKKLLMEFLRWLELISSPSNPIEWGSIEGLAVRFLTGHEIR